MLSEFEWVKGLMEVFESFLAYGEEVLTHFFLDKMDYIGIFSLEES